MATSNIVIDLSHHNENVDLAEVSAAGIVGVIHKATQGSGFKDPRYAARRRQAQQAGLLWGAYHFATAADPVAQAKFFLSVSQPGLADLVVLDFEQNEGTPGNTMTLNQARTFISTVQDTMGITPGLYGGAYLKQQLSGAERRHARRVLALVGAVWVLTGNSASVVRLDALAIHRRPSRQSAVRHRWRGSLRSRSISGHSGRSPGEVGDGNAGLTRAHPSVRVRS